MSKKLIIIGAGISGLYAATELGDHYQITILEANEYNGGRIRSILTGNTLIEAGAEFLHGKNTLTAKLLRDIGIEPTKAEGKIYRFSEGRLKEQEEYIEGWDQLLKEMHSVQNDMSLLEFLQAKFPGPDKEVFRSQVQAFSEGFDIADPSKASVQSLYKEWKNQDEQFRVPGGYGQLAEGLAAQALGKGVTFLYGHRVNQVDWQEGEVTVYGNSKQFIADRLLVTVPLSILQLTAAKASINFTPPIDHHVSAARLIGYGSAIKIIFKFKKIVWPSDAGFMLSTQPVQAWWSQLPDTAPILTGWIGGPKAEELKNASEDQIRDLALNSLATILSLDKKRLSEELEQSFIFNWHSQPEALGAYSYPTLYDEGPRSQLQQPLASTVFFAGEGMYSGEYPGTVEAALQNTRESISKILQY